MPSAFICWSGDRSKAIARAFRETLPNVVGGLDCRMSDDIPKGADWFGALIQSLEGCGAGILCLTPENIEAPWLHFEAGALLRQVGQGIREGKIFPFLFGLNDLTGPLSAIQATRFDKDETEQLVIHLAEHVGAKVGDFDAWWSEFRQRLISIQPLAISDLVPEFDEMFDRKTFNEPFPECVEQRWRERFWAIAETLVRLREANRNRQLERHSYHAALYRKLIRQLDHYAMVLGATLIVERPYQELSDEHQMRCEQARQDVVTTVRRLLRPYRPPKFEESLRFEAIEEADERKRLIHEMELKLGGISREEIQSARDSLDWGLDRIVYYLAALPQAADPLGLAACVRREEEQARTRNLVSGLQPLYYAVEALQSAVSARPVPIDDGLRDEVLSTLEQVEVFLDADSGRDRGEHIRSQIKQTRARLEATS